MNECASMSIGLSTAVCIDAICDEYEAVRRQGENPVIEGYFDRVKQGRQEILLRELLTVELDYQLARERETLEPCVGEIGLTRPAGTGSEWAATPRMFGRYDLKEVLGEGSFAKVYRATDTLLQREVAVKVFKESVVWQAHDGLWLEEARTASALCHTNIVPVFEAGEMGGIRYITTCLYEATPLNELIREGGAFKTDEAARIVQQLADALAYAHGKGVIHRDIKPANVLLSSTRGPLLLDFGLARRLSQMRDPAGDGPIGSWAYMSPEQASGRSNSADARSDLWSLGVVLYELLTGTRPFTGTQEQIKGAICGDEPPSPRKLRRSVPARLSKICMKCLAKHRDDRYRSAQTLANDLKGWIESRNKWLIGLRRITVCCGVVSLFGALLLAFFSHSDKTLPALYDNFDAIEIDAERWETEGQVSLDQGRLVLWMSRNGQTCRSTASTRINPRGVGLTGFRMKGDRTGHHVAAGSSTATVSLTNGRDAIRIRWLNDLNLLSVEGSGYYGDGELARVDPGVPGADDIPDGAFEVLQRGPDIEVRHDSHSIFTFKNKNIKPGSYFLAEAEGNSALDREFRLFIDDLQLFSRDDNIR